MENYLNSNTIKALEKLINYIKESKDYKEYVYTTKEAIRELIKQEKFQDYAWNKLYKSKLFSEISENKELTKLINEVRVSQKKYVRSNFKEEEKKLMDEKLNLLNTNKTYTLYLYYLNNVNNMIELIKDELNDYFYKVTNIL